MLRIITALILLLGIQIPDEAPMITILIYVPLIALLASGISAEKKRGRI